MAEPRRLTPADNVKVPPHSIEAEQSLLGGLMLSSGAWDKVADRVSEADFYRDDHRRIFRAIGELREGNRPCDAVTVTEWFERHGELERVDGGAYITMLANESPGAANAVAYADIVREKSILRQLIDIGTDIADTALTPSGHESKHLLEMAEQKIYAIADQGTRRTSSYVSMREMLPQAIDRLNEICNREDDITGVPTAFEKFDDMTAGLQPSDLIIVAGRPAMGKTTFAMNIAENAALRKGTPVAIFSMEMSAMQLVMRMFSSLGQIDQNRMRTGRLSDQDWVNLRSALEILNKAEIYIDETPSLSPTEIRARARRLKRENNIGLVVVDYLQLMQVPDNKENRATEIGEISRGLKALARELNIPVIALSQLNRSLEQRPNKRPVMADLRESGAIEQDADLIVFIYRDEIYNEDSADKGKAEIIIGKHRNGATGKVELVFQGEYLRFRNFTPDYYGLDG